jgi:hypothetical protein
MRWLSRNKRGMIEAVSKSGNPTNGERLHENADTSGFSRWYVSFNVQSKTAEILRYHRL